LSTENWLIKMPFCSVLFDLDGTLLDTLDDLADSMNAALACLGFPQHEVQCYRTFVGDGIRALAERVLPEEDKSEEMVQACVNAMRDEYERRWRSKSRPYPGVNELTEELRRREVAMAVLSNKPDSFTRKVVEHFFPNTGFRKVQGALPDVHRKPNPAAAISIAQKLDIAPSDWLYVGDTDTDMKTACAAGMFPVGVTWGFRDAQELRDFGAKELIDSPMELLKLLD
jgi:phosphoglycolate phosphatase